MVVGRRLLLVVARPSLRHMSFGVNMCSEAEAQAAFEMDRSQAIVPSIGKLGFAEIEVVWEDPPVSDPSQLLYRVTIGEWDDDPSDDDPPELFFMSASLCRWWSLASVSHAHTTPARAVPNGPPLNRFMFDTFHGEPIQPGEGFQFKSVHTPTALAFVPFFFFFACSHVAAAFSSAVFQRRVRVAERPARRWRSPAAVACRWRWRWRWRRRGCRGRRMRPVPCVRPPVCWRAVVRRWWLAGANGNPCAQQACGVAGRPVPPHLDAQPVRV